MKIPAIPERVPVLETIENALTVDDLLPGGIPVRVVLTLDPSPQPDPPGALGDEDNDLLIASFCEV